MNAPRVAVVLTVANLVLLAAGVDSLLRRALGVARVAETTNSEYEAAIRWTEANLIAADAVALLISRIPAPPSR